MTNEMGKSAKRLLGTVSSFFRGHMRAFSCLGHGYVRKDGRRFGTIKEL